MAEEFNWDEWFEVGDSLYTAYAHPKPEYDSRVPTIPKYKEGVNSNFSDEYKTAIKKWHKDRDGSWERSSFGGSDREMDYMSKMINHSHLLPQEIKGEWLETEGKYKNTQDKLNTQLPLYYKDPDTDVAKLISPFKLFDIYINDIEGLDTFDRMMWWPKKGKELLNVLSPNPMTQMIEMEDREKIFE